MTATCPECENRGRDGAHLRGCFLHPDPASRRLGWNLHPYWNQGIDNPSGGGHHESMTNQPTKEAR